MEGASGIGARAYHSAMRSAARLVCIAALAGSSGAVFARPFDLPDIPRCTEVTPGAVSVDDTPVTLGLRVVLDGVSAGQADAFVAAARSSYAPLNIALLVSYDSAGFSSSDGGQLINEVKAFYGGSRPAGTHLVYVLTAKNLTDGGAFGDSLAGLADCIGGVAYPQNAFAVGEADPEIAAKVMAHELGHLLGAHHHYANCAEALPNGGDNVCTLMINDVGLAALPFSTLNGTVVRGHAQLAGSASTASGGGGSGSGGSFSLLALLVLLSGALTRRRVLL